VRLCWLLSWDAREESWSLVDLFSDDPSAALYTPSLMVDLSSVGLIYHLCHSVLVIGAYLFAFRRPSQGVGVR
jgi:hypothetical protein